MSAKTPVPSTAPYPAWKLNSAAAALDRWKSKRSSLNWKKPGPPRAFKPQGNETEYGRSAPESSQVPRQLDWPYHSDRAWSDFLAGPDRSTLGPRKDVAGPADHNRRSETDRFRPASTATKRTISSRRSAEHGIGVDRSRKIERISIFDCEFRT